MPLGTDVGRSPDDIVLDGNSAPLPKKGAEPPPQLHAHVYYGQTAGWIKMSLGMDMGLGPGHIMLDGDPAAVSPPIFGPFLLWPNGWMHQDATWYGGRPQSRRLCVRWGPSPPPLKRHRPPVFGQCPLWPNGRMDYDASWYGGRPRPRRLCVRWGPNYPQKKGTPIPTKFLAHVCCDQMAGWMKTPLGTEVHLGSDHIVLDGVSLFFSAHVYRGQLERFSYARVFPAPTIFFIFCHWYFIFLHCFHFRQADNSSQLPSNGGRWGH